MQLRELELRVLAATRKVSPPGRLNQQANSAILAVRRYVLNLGVMAVLKLERLSTAALA